MGYGSIVEKTINSLKHRLEIGQGVFDIYSGEGDLSPVKCSFNQPATIKEIQEFEASMGVVFPEDYKKFLLITNGCRLFDHPQYGGESYLLTLDEMLNYTFEDRFDGCFKVAYIYGENIVINSTRYINGEKNYLYVKDKIDSFEDSKPLNMNFELWLDRFVISQGSKFWSWSIYTAENYYRLR